MIEIIARDTCPTCDGNGRFYDRDADDFLQCSSCHGVGTVPRVLATFADAAAVGKAIREAVNGRLNFDGMDDDEWDDIRDAVLAALGVNDD